MQLSGDQHNIEIHQNRKAFEKKPILNLIYGNFYRDIKKRLIQRSKGVTVEMGSGIGIIKNHIPDCITSDLFENPWLDRVENAYGLQFENNTITNLILFDVWHHLQYPATALAEFNRVLLDGGRLIIFEPAMGCIGKIIYGFFHHEPIALHEPITWYAPDDFNIEKQAYYAAQGNCWRMFRENTLPKQIELGWRLREVSFYPALAYVASGGFSKPQLFPSLFLPMIMALEHLLQRFPTIFATRMLVVLEKAK